ncbi:MAG TPA: hypothetical protein VLG47_01990 [Candidatus Saccharimonadales bacterium]|nr:hypothetical protein [Candidatus Saccharimonadales bacterium]
MWLTNTSTKFETLSSGHRGYVEATTTKVLSFKLDIEVAYHGSFSANKRTQKFTAASVKLVCERMAIDYFGDV